jgi:uncharacterized protein YjgD (DUF1641 family)
MSEQKMSHDGTINSAADHLLERLSEPAVSEGLNRLLDRMDTLSIIAESLDGFIRRGEVIAENLASTVGELKHVDVGDTAGLMEKAPQYLKTGTKMADAACSINIDELQQSKILERLTDPTTLSALNNLLDRLPLIAFFANAMQGFLERGETFTDNLGSLISEFHLREIDPQKVNQLLESIPKLQQVGEKLLDSGLLDKGMTQLLDAGSHMLETGMLDTKVVTTLGELGRISSKTYQEVSHKEIQPIGGIFAIMRATKDPDVQKSLGFAFAFAKEFAKHIK